MRKHWNHSTIRLRHGGSREIDLSELDLVSTSHVGVVSGVLVCLVEDEIRVLVDKFLHRILHKLIERVQLLPHETFLVEKAGYNGPAILLRYFFIVIFVVVIVRFIIGIWVLCFIF